MGFYGQMQNGFNGWHLDTSVYLDRWTSVHMRLRDKVSSMWASDKGGGRTLLWVREQEYL